MKIKQCKHCDFQCYDYAYMAKHTKSVHENPTPQTNNNEQTAELREAITLLLTKDKPYYELTYAAGYDVSEQVVNLNIAQTIQMIENILDLITKRDAEIAGRARLDAIERFKDWADNTEVTYNDMMAEQLKQLKQEGK